jgi:hypothetical protein
MRHASFLIGGLMLLAACAEPQSKGSPAQPAATGSSGPIVVATPGAADKMQNSADPFPAVPAGYRALGGVFFHAGTTMIVTPDKSVPLQKHDTDVGLLHGMAVGGYSEEKTLVRESDCRGAGDTPKSAIIVEGLKDPAAEEVAAGIACARLLHPGTQWLMSQTIAGDNGYLSQIMLGDGSGTPVIVYTDINRMANQLIKELGD